MTKPSSEAKPISRSTLSGQVTERLRADIVSGVFAPGDQLNEAQLAREFGVSRGPLREAMQRLIQDGLLHNKPHRGVFVPELTDQDLEDIYFTREAIETAAVRRVMAMGRAVEVSELLMREVEHMIAALQDDDWNRVIDHDLSFHTQLVEAADSGRLSRMYSVLIAETRLCLHLLVSGFEGRRDFVEEHIALAERLAAEDSAGALEAVRNHLQQPLESIARQRQADAQAELEATAGIN